jgi:hypothetical protein
MRDALQASLADVLAEQAERRRIGRAREAAANQTHPLPPGDRADAGYRDPDSSMIRHAFRDGRLRWPPFVAGYSPAVGRYADTTVRIVWPILILSRFFSSWGRWRRRPLSQVPLVEPRSSTYHRPRTAWKRMW